MEESPLDVDDEPSLTLLVVLPEIRIGVLMLTVVDASPFIAVNFGPTPMTFKMISSKICRKEELDDNRGGLP